MTLPFKLNVLELRGKARERGRQHGEALREQIHQLLDAHLEMVSQSGVKSPRELIGRVVEDTGLIAAAERYTPELVEEARGIAEGARLAEKSVLAWQCLEEFAWLLPSLARSGAAPQGQTCSVLGVYGEGGPAILAQTADNGVPLDGYQTLLHKRVPGSSLDQLVFTYPGVVGIYGTNSRAIAVTINSLSSRLNYSPNGLPASFVAQGILAQPDRQSAERFIHSVRHATGDCYGIGSPDRVSVFECSPGQVREFVPPERPTRVYHTNHPLVNDDQDASLYSAMTPEQQAQSRASTEARFDELRSQLSDSSLPVDVPAVKSILSSHTNPDLPICRHRVEGQPWMTNACLIMVLSPSEPELHVAPGPTCQSEFRIYRF